MSEPQSKPEASQRETAEGSNPIQHPTDHVVGILDTQDQTNCSVDGLVGGGFLESEIGIGHGPKEADRLDATSGRRGGQDWWIRGFQRLGLENAEIELKERYEQALRDGATAIAVLAPTEDRKDLAAKILAGCDAHFINYFGRLKVQRIGR
jgi:hypothetical protein